MTGDVEVHLAELYETVDGWVYHCLVCGYESRPLTQGEARKFASMHELSTGVR